MGRVSGLLWTQLLAMVWSFKINPTDHAVVTLVTGERSGYSAGALALGQSLLDVGSQLSRVVLVTPEVEDYNRELMSKLWTVIEIQPIACNHKLDPSITSDQFDLQGEQYLAGIQRWQATCSKFAVWTLTQFKRVVFMDSDTIVLQPIDDILYGFSNATFAAAPETFPPDTFNSGVMVLNPSQKTFQHLLNLNQQIGSAEGGDQGVFNNGLCPHWFTADSDDLSCGRLPWLFNVEAANFVQYQTLRKMSNLRLPAVVHFVSDGKPWKIIAMEYMNLTIPPATLTELKKQEYVHIFWRIEFFKATGDIPPQRSSFGEETDKIFQSLLDNISKAGGGKQHGGKGKKANYIQQLDIFYEKNQRYQEVERQREKKLERDQLLKRSASLSRRDEEQEDDEELQESESKHFKREARAKNLKRKQSPKFSSNKVPREEGSGRSRRSESQQAGKQRKKKAKRRRGDT